MKILKKIALFLFFLFLTSIISGQTDKDLSVIYLKDGRFLFGQLIEEKEASII